MSLVALLSVAEGIAIAADRRSTSSTLLPSKKKNYQECIGMVSNDHSDKVFVCNNDCIIAVTGKATLQERNIKYWISNFMKEYIHRDIDITQMPELMFSYIASFDEMIDTHFVIAGYDKNKKKHIYDVSILEQEYYEYDTSVPTGLYIGATYCVDHLLKACVVTDTDGHKHQLPEVAIRYELFTLKDAIQFCRFLIDLTKQMLDFIDYTNTVGGNTDVLVIKEDGVTWIQKEELV